METDESKTFLTTEQLAERWQKHPGSIERLRKTGRGPKYIKVTKGPRGAVLYRLSDVLEHERNGER